MTARTPEEARAFIEQSSFVWHQRWELVDGVTTPGTHPIDVLFDLGEVERDLRGKRVLDVGTSNGGAAFLMERRGAAHVVAFDIYPPDWFGFEHLRTFLGSNVEYVQGSVYSLTRLVGEAEFDFVLFWGVLYHLRHPLLAMDEVRAAVVPGGRVDVETAISDDELSGVRTLPVTRFYRRDELANDGTNWFAPTASCLHDWCGSAGLEVERVAIWGEGADKRALAVTRRTDGRPEYIEVSYELPLRAETFEPPPEPPELPEPLAGPGLAARYSPPKEPWTAEYAAMHRRFVSDVLDDPQLIAPFKDNGDLPLGYGLGLDERVVEIPWLLTRELGGRVLDAGSSLNHDHVLDRVLSLASDLHVVTLAPEAQAFTERKISYVYADLRDLPYRDGFFDVAVSISTLEHVGMDNAFYGVDAPRAADPTAETRAAVAELCRVASRCVLITVPYGRREDHGWLRQFDRDGVEELCSILPGRPTVTVFRYTETGWRRSDFNEASEMRYRDFRADPSPVKDLAAAARAVACIATAA
jgi:SAM-dependent methyltransferase